MPYPHPCVSENLLRSFSMNSTSVRSPGTVSVDARGKRGIGQLFRYPLNLRSLGALWEGLTIAGNTFLECVDHHGIRKDKSDHVLGVGLTLADSLPVFVSLELREREPIRHFHRVLVLGTYSQYR